MPFSLGQHLAQGDPSKKKPRERDFAPAKHFLGPPTISLCSPSPSRREQWPILGGHRWRPGHRAFRDELGGKPMLSPEASVALPHPWVRPHSPVCLGHRLQVPQGCSAPGKGGERNSIIESTVCDAAHELDNIRLLMSVMPPTSLITLDHCITEETGSFHKGK